MGCLRKLVPHTTETHLDQPLLLHNTVGLCRLAKESDMKQAVLHKHAILTVEDGVHGSSGGQTRRLWSRMKMK